MLSSQHGLLGDPDLGPLLQPLGPGVARLRAGALTALPRLARLGGGSWTNARLLAELAGHPAPPGKAVEQTYGPGARMLAERLGIERPGEEPVRAADAVLSEARARFSAPPAQDRRNGSRWGQGLAVPRPPRLEAREEEALLACHRALLRGEPLAAKVERKSWQGLERLRGPFQVHSIGTSPEGVMVELSERRGHRRFRADLGDILVGAPGAQPRHSWRRAGRGGRR